VSKVSYRQQIEAIAPLHNARHIEAMMRVEHSTLDKLSSSRFRTEVKFACACIDECGDEQAERIAKSFGI
jgi:hypothetical protein